MRVLDDWLLTPERVAVHLPSGTAVVADLHLGYDQARRRAGEAVPAIPLGGQLAALGAALSRHGVRRLAVAGDLLEDGRCREVLADFRAWLDRHGLELAGVVPGNHDLKGEGGGGKEDSAPFILHPSSFILSVGSWQVVHGDGPLPAGPFVQGHEHPWVRWRRGPDGPCYLVSDARLVLPAYSADAAGVNVLGVRRWRDFRCCVIAGDRVLDFGPVGRLRRSP
jgi:metallophosphoesterase superfamily enzyme